MIIRHYGFTLIELLASIAILTILLAMAAPSMAGLKQRSEITSTHNLLLTGFASARQHAVINHRLTSICPGNTNTGCRSDGVWSDGWLIFVDRNDNGRLDAGDTVVHHENRIPSNVRVKSGAGRPRATFRPDGTAGGTNLTLRLCAADEVRAAVILSNVGRARSASTRELAGMANCG